MLVRYEGEDHSANAPHVCLLVDLDVFSTVKLRFLDQLSVVIPACATWYIPGHICYRRPAVYILRGCLSRAWTRMDQC